VAVAGPSPAATPMPPEAPAARPRPCRTTSTSPFKNFGRHVEAMASSLFEMARHGQRWITAVGHVPRPLWMATRGAAIGVATATVAWKMMVPLSDCTTGTGWAKGVDGPSCFAAWGGYGLAYVFPVAVVVSVVVGWVLRVRLWLLVGLLGTFATAAVALWWSTLDGWLPLAVFAGFVYAVLAILAFGFIAGSRARLPY
jgi:hypothetical protein